VSQLQGTGLNPSLRRGRRLLAALSISTIGALIEATAAPVLITPLGDSITQADSEHYGYRYALWRKLIDAQLSLDLVGSMSTSFGGNPHWPRYEGFRMDPHHEGHWGWETNEILAGRPGAGSLATWLQSYTPDIVLLHLGTNDALSGHSTSSTVQELEQVILTLQADNPAVVVLIAKLIPSTDPNGSRIPLVNAEIEGIARRRQTPLSRVVVVDQWTGFDPLVDLYDPWHPDASGEAKMAQNWFETLMAVPPFEVRVYPTSDAGTFAWASTPGAQSYVVYRGMVSSLADANGDGLADAGYGGCAGAVDAGGDEVLFSDPGPDPPVGQAAFLLVAPVTLHGEVSLGASSTGLRRHPSAPCPSR
jgi:hypothetical protein